MRATTLTSTHLQPSASQASKLSARLLVVDDDRSLLMVMEELLQQEGYHVTTVRSADDALPLLEKQSFDVLVLDREMPGMNGLDMVRQLQGDNRYRRLPIIMQTASDAPEQIQEGIDAGVFYYLTKPLQRPLLSSIVAAAVSEVHRQQTLKGELASQRGIFAAIDTCRFIIRTLQEAESLASFAANCFPDPARAARGIAELLVNAVEHGNLGITYREKTHLLHTGSWRREVERRQQMPSYADKKVEVIVQCKQDGCYLRVTDDGDGFDWKRYLDIDPARALDNHGRGIAQAGKLSFDELQYNIKGNQVTAVMRLPAATDDQLMAWAS